MGYFNERGTVLEKELFRGSDGKNYLKSPALDRLKDKKEYPGLNRLYRDDGDWKDLFGAFLNHLDATKGLTYVGFLLAVGDLYGQGRLKRYQIEEHILKDIFPVGLSGDVKSRYVYRKPESEADNHVEEKDASVKTVTDSEKKGVWKYLPF